MTTPERPPFRLADEERADLAILFDGLRSHRVSWRDLLAHVTELCEAYYGAGLVEGDLAHDGTIRAEVAAQ